MKNIKYYEEEAFEFYEAVIITKRNSKKYPTFKSDIGKIKSIIKKLFDDYDNNFTNNTLPLLIPNSFSKDEVSLLENLYSFGNSKIKELYLFLTTDDNNKRKSTCQHCTINRANTLDHFAGQTEFREFVIHPKNLVPCCSECNGKKGNRWRNNNKHLFINLYIDILPNKQYLFVDLIVNANDIGASFYIDNRNKLDRRLYDIIENHYTKLELFQRFQELSNEVIVELDNQIKLFSQSLDIAIIKQISIKQFENEKLQYGHNYWKIILKLALIKNDDFLNRYR